jgi:hypothetical protein
MATEFDDTEELHYVGFYTGTVADNEDPEQLGRVRVNIPGMIEPASAWAFPLGTLAGGSAGRGWFAVPAQDADVGVFFFQGDVDTLFYVPAHWGVDGGTRETPLQLDGLDKTSRLKVTGYETDRYQMVFDERDPAQFFVLDKQTGDSVVMNPEKTVLKHSALVVVDAPKVYLGGDDVDENPISGDGVVLASAVDPFSGKTHGQLAGASTRVFAKKV